MIRKKELICFFNYFIHRVIVLLLACIGVSMYSPTLKALSLSAQAPLPVFDTLGPCDSREDCIECRHENEDAVCWGAPHEKNCFCIKHKGKREGDECEETEDCKPCKDDNLFRRCSVHDRICKCKPYRSKLGEACERDAECKAECEDGDTVCSGPRNEKVCKCASDE